MRNFSNRFNSAIISGERSASKSESMPPPTSVRGVDRIKISSIKAGFGFLGFKDNSFSRLGFVIVLKSVVVGSSSPTKPALAARRSTETCAAASCCAAAAASRVSNFASIESRS